MWGELSESKLSRKVVPGTAPPEIKLKMLFFFLNSFFDWNFSISKVG